MSQSHFSAQGQKKYRWTKKFSLLLVLLALIVSGCRISLGQRSVSVAGVFRSADRGENWQTRNLFLHGDGAGTIAGVSVLDLVFDPQDDKAIYLTSESSGLFYTYDGTKSWQKAEGLGTGRIESVVIDPQNKCVIYATFANTVRKSFDCNRTWREVYIDTRSDKTVTALAIDHYNNLIIYAGNVSGDIFKSVDGGSNWQVVNRLGNRVMKILVDATDSRIIYVATQKKGIFKSLDAGATWFDLNDELKKFSGALEYRDLIFDQSQPDSLLLVAKYGLLKTEDGGNTWQDIKLITPVASTDIFAVAINPRNNQEIYYATASTFYKSTDGGQNWITRRLPSNNPAGSLLIDKASPNIVYLGMRVPPKK